MAGDGNNDDCGTDSELVRDSSEFFGNLLAEDGTPRFSDSQISCEGELFEVQRAVLAGFSPVLNQLFVQHQQDSPGQPLELGKGFVTRDSFALIWDLIYKGRITVDGDNVLRLHSAANYLQIDQIVRKCADFVVKRLHVDTVIPVWQYACTDTANAKDILEPALRFLDENFSRLLKHDTVLALGIKEFSLLLCQLCKVEDENLVLKSALEWLAHDWKARFCNSERVMSCVHWQAIDYTLLLGLQALATLESKVDRDSKDELVAMNTIFSRIFQTASKNVVPGPTGPEVYYLVFKTKSCWSFRKLSVLQQGQNSVPTISMTDEKAIHALRDEDVCGFFAFQGQLFCVVWSQREGEDITMIAAISDSGDYKIRAKLEQGDKSYSPFSFNFSNGTLCSMECGHSRENYSLSIYNLAKLARRFANDDSCFLISRLYQVEVEDTEQRMHLDATMIPVGNDVYFFGCVDNNKCVGVDVLHVSKQTWTKLPCLRNPHLPCSVSLANRTCFVAGGRDRNVGASKSVEMMNIDDPTDWTQLPGLKIGRRRSYLINCGHFLIAFGGYGVGLGGRYVYNAEILDLENLAKGWEEYPPLHGVDPKFLAKM